MIMFEEGTDHCFTARDPITQEVIYKCIFQPKAYPLMRMYARSVARAHCQVVRVCFDNNTHEDINP